MVANRPRPFAGVAGSAASSRPDGGRSSRNSRRRSSGGSDDDPRGGDGIVRAQSHALQAFRFLCRSGQLCLSEQLALSGVWDVGMASGNSIGDANGRGAGIEPTTVVRALFLNYCMIQTRIWTEYGPLGSGPVLQRHPRKEEAPG